MNKFLYILFLTFLNPFVIFVCTGFTNNTAIGLAITAVWTYLWFKIRQQFPELDKECSKLIVGRYK